MKQYPYLFPALTAPTLGVAMMFAAVPAVAQSTSGSLSGTITDPSGAFVPGATVDLSNAVSGYHRTTTALSSIVTALSPGIAADSNGLLHGLGDHNEVSFSIDGQPVTDQQSKVFSNQVPAAAIQSLEVIEGAPPAEYGDKTSLVIVGTTRSGQGVTTPTGSVTMSYGSFGSSNLAVDVAYGGAKWGNFVAANGLQSGRFLDAPEFAVYHDKVHAFVVPKPEQLRHGIWIQSERTDAGRYRSAVED